ncbi:MAG: copper amine oxidase N-terminal domain-containing protein, partial [Tumebacillaceae bacterium]
QVQWDPATQTVTLTNKDGKVVKLQIGNKQATVDGKPVSLEVPATVVNDRTLVPLRALADFFNLQVNWDNAAEMAILK